LVSAPRAPRLIGVTLSEQVDLAPGFD